MNHVITIGDIVHWGLAVAAVVVIISVLLYVLSVFGAGMSR